MLPDDDLDDPAVAPAATLLPALDPTPMGWKARQWLLGIDRHHLFDRAGNIGPTLWWDGEVIGSWAVTPAGDLRTAVLADRGAEADEAVEAAAALLHDRLDGAAVTPAARTPLERALSQPPTTCPPRPGTLPSAPTTAGQPEGGDAGSRTSAASSSPAPSTRPP